VLQGRHHGWRPHEGRGGNVAKTIAGGDHQVHPLNKAVQATLRATSPKGDRKAGVIWSVRVNDQWRIIFRWTGDSATDVRLVDCH
jgi:hypothetical protein